MLVCHPMLTLLSPCFGRAAAVFVRDSLWCCAVAVLQSSSLETVSSPPILYCCAGRDG